MSQENTQAEKVARAVDAVVEKKEARLLKFDDNTTSGSAKDINSKISTLDSDLDHLRAELVTINNSVEEGLDRLSDSGTDLTAKVSETYKRLGEIDNAYKSLMEISSRIDVDIQTLNGDVGNIAQQSASGIKNLEQSSIAQSHEFTQKNQQVASRVNQLVETSKITSELLNQKIQSNTEGMLKIEKSITTEIKTLASATKEKTDSIENIVDSNKAKILKLQSVDEAIIRRATTLEISSAELSVSAQHMSKNIAILEKSSEALFSGVSELKTRTDELEELTDKQGFIISGLQKATSDIANKVTVLTGLENTHFKIVGSGFLALLLATVTIYFMQQNQFELNDSRYVERSVSVDEQITSMQQERIKSNAAINTSLVKIKSELASVQDQAQSVEGRLSQTSPFSYIANDNILHGEQWIAALPKDNFALQLAYVDDKKSLFEIAQRYNFYLKDSLSYFSVKDDISVEDGAVKYVLLTGSYASQQQALTAMDNLPAYIDMQRPLIRKLDDIQNYIVK